MRYSLVIPVYNRPDEVRELLESLTRQREKDFEVVVVEDGSSVASEDVVRHCRLGVPVAYVRQANAGPAAARNNGAGHAKGDYLIFLDSDAVVPDHYLEEITRELTAQPADAFGGPDRAHESFTPVQKAINYSMTSFLTTGGIRGGKKKLDKFYPRSFNMGISRELFERLRGFSRDMRFGEDIDFSIRIFESGAACRLLPEAWVWHKRRTDFRKFFRQVHNSGIARINLTKRHPGTLRLVHCLPAAFTVSLVLLVHVLPYALVVFAHASYVNRSLRVGALSVVASYIQLVGYGTGFLRAWWQRCVLRKDSEMQAFEKTFYK